MTLWGDPDLCHGGSALKSTLRSFHVGDKCFLVQLWPVTVAEVEDSGILEEIMRVLEEN